MSLDCAAPSALAAFYRDLLDATIIWEDSDSAGVQLPGIVLVAQRVSDYLPPAWCGAVRRSTAQHRGEQPRAEGGSSRVFDHVRRGNARDEARSAAAERFATTTVNDEGQYVERSRRSAIYTRMPGRRCVELMGNSRPPFPPASDSVSFDPTRSASPSAHRTASTCSKLVRANMYREARGTRSYVPL